MNTPVGAIIPSSNTTVENELKLMYRTGLILEHTFHIYRVDYETRFSESYEKYSIEIGRNLPAALKSLKKVNGLENIGFFCTTASQFLTKDMLVEVINPVNAIKGLLHFYKVLQPLVITPYNNLISQGIINTLGIVGATTVINLNKLTAHEISNQPSLGIVHLVSENFIHGHHDATLFLCTNFPTLHIAPTVRRITEKPFISSNLSILSSLLNKQIEELLTNY